MSICGLPPQAFYACGIGLGVGTGSVGIGTSAGGRSWPGPGSSGGRGFGSIANVDLLGRWLPTMNDKSADRVQWVWCARIIRSQRNGVPGGQRMRDPNGERC
jgi:hypothetical protein